MARRPLADGVLAVGLGRFDGAVADTLVSLGHEVLAVDTDPKIVQGWSGRLTHVAEADATNERRCASRRAQSSTGLSSGSATTSSRASSPSRSWSTSASARSGKAISRAHGRILDRVSAHHVVHPEREMGKQIAHIVTGQMVDYDVDYIEFDDGFTLVETRPSAELVGRTRGRPAPGAGTA